MNFFKTLITRVASLSTESYNINKDDIVGFLKENKLFELSILIASRSLYDDIKKNKDYKTRKPIGNYFARAHFNPVPFGTFASIGVLNWSDNTKIIKSTKTFLRIEYDSLFLTIKQAPIIDSNWREFTYYSNPSIHFLNDTKVSFYKSEKLLDGKCETKYVELDYDENINWIIEKFNNGKKIDLVIKELNNDGFNEEEIHEYLKRIINVGLILNEILYYPYRTPTLLPELSSEMLKTGCFILNKDREYEIFKNNYIEEQNSLLTDENNKYSHSITSFDENIGEIDSLIKTKIKKFINFHITQNSNHNPINESLSKFGSKFYNLHQDKFIPLAKVFNPYSGLKYSSKRKEEEFSTYVMDKILATENSEIYLNKNWSGSKEKIDYKKMPSTFNVVFELLNCKKSGKQIVYCKHLIGPSSLPLLARFDHISDSLCIEIANYEKKVYQNQILAEVNMFILARTNNVIASHQYYDYCLPLNTVYKNESRALFLSDLYLRYNGTKFIFVSKTHNKEIIPRITSVVNSALSDSDIYRFLADLQHQNNEIYQQNFNLNSYEDIYIHYVPRIFLEEDILLEPAQLLIYDSGYSLNEFKLYFVNRIKKYSFPNKVSFFDKGSEIIIDINSQDHLILLFQKLKKLKKIYISEILYESFTPEVRNKKLNYSHEIVACIKNKDFQSSKDDSIFVDEKDSKIDYPPVISDWLYFNIYSNSYAENEILNVVYNQIFLKDNSILFYYLRYNYPENHLRLRFKTNNRDVVNLIFETINILKTQNTIQNYSLLPYEPEVYRYGGRELMILTENIFGMDSIHTIEKLPIYDSVKNHYYYFSVMKINSYLHYFNLSLEEKIIFCEWNIKNFSREFVLKPENKKELGKIYRGFANELIKEPFSSFLNEIEIEKTIEKSKLDKYDYISDIIHMSINRIFSSNQKLNELKSYILCKKYISQVKYFK